MKTFFFFFVLFFMMSITAQTPGTLDTSFSGDGFDTFAFHPTGYLNHSKAIATNNTRIYVAGLASDGTLNRASCIAYTMSGIPDTTFSDDGKFQLAYGENSIVLDIKIQPDNKIVMLVMFGFGVELAVIRLNPDGSFDDTWSDDGIVYFNPTESSDFGVNLELQQDGKVIACGYGDTALRTNFLTRFNTDGTHDLAYGDNGCFKYIMPSYYGMVRDMALQPDGKALMAIHEGVGIDNHSHIVRIDTDGTIDTTFNGTGAVITLFGYYRGITVIPNGQILVTDSQNGYAKVRRFNTDGQPDLAFNGTGFCTTSAYFEAHDIFYRNGKIILIGSPSSIMMVPDDFGIYAFNEDGTTDTGFGNQGIAITDLGQPDEIAYRGVIQADGKILITGDYGSNTRFVTLRYHGAQDLGIDEHQSDLFSLYPNPSDGMVNLRFNQRFSEIKISILDLLGQEIYRQEFFNPDVAQLNISGSPGLYFIKVKTPDDESIIKMVKR